jgi:flagellar hook assembly protein FlgD
VVSLDPDVGVAERLNLIPAPEFHLYQNHPNPLHGSATISYSLPQDSQVTLSIYDITGRLVETLVNGTQQSGIHQVQWNRKDNPSGVYFYRLRASGFLETRKMMVVE